MSEIVKLANKFISKYGAEGDPKLQVQYDEKVHGPRVKPFYMSDEAWEQSGQKYPIEGKEFTQEDFERAPYQYSLGGYPAHIQGIKNVLKSMVENLKFLEAGNPKNLRNPKQIKMLNSILEQSYELLLEANGKISSLNEAINWND